MLEAAVNTEQDIYVVILHVCITSLFYRRGNKNSRCKLPMVIYQVGGAAGFEFWSN